MGKFYMNGATSMPKSVLRYSEDKVRQGSEIIKLQNLRKNSTCHKNRMTKELLKIEKSNSTLKI